MYTYQGKTTREWALALGKDRRNVHNNFQKYGFPFNKKECVQRGLIQSKGRVYSSVYLGKSYSKWAQDLGVSVQTIYRNIDQHGNLKHIRPSNANKQNATLYEGKSVYKWAEELGMTSQAIRARISKYGKPNPTFNKEGYDAIGRLNSGEYTKKGYKEPVRVA